MSGVCWFSSQQFMVIPQVLEVSPLAKRKNYLILLSLSVSSEKKAYVLLRLSLLNTVNAIGRAMTNNQGPIGYFFLLQF